MDLRVARLAQAHQVAGIVGTALGNRKNMMNFLVLLIGAAVKRDSVAGMMNFLDRC